MYVIGLRERINEAWQLKAQGRELGRVRGELTRWRAQHGGRGRRLPEELWSAAADVASVEGIQTTARVLSVDRERLARRVAARGGRPPAAGARSAPALSASFIEVDAESVFARGRTVVRLLGREGERLEIALEGGAVSVSELMRAFWSRGR